MIDAWFPAIVRRPEIQMFTEQEAFDIGGYEGPYHS